jgi:hypothetical protein
VRSSLLAAATLLAVAGCASSSSSTPSTAAQPDQPDRIRTTYQGQNGRSVSARRESDTAHDVEVPAAAARVWQAVPIAYDRLGLKLAESDPTRGEVSTVYHRVRGRLGRARVSDYLDCGSGALGLPAADNYQVNFQVTTQLLPDSLDRKTTVRTFVRATAKPDAVSGDPVACLSTGSFERLVGEYTAEAVTAVKQ